MGEADTPDDPSELFEGSEDSVDMGRPYGHQRAGSKVSIVVVDILIYIDSFLIVLRTTILVQDVLQSFDDYLVSLYRSNTKDSCPSIR